MLISNERSASNTPTTVSKFCLLMAVVFFFTFLLFKSEEPKEVCGFFPCSVANSFLVRFTYLPGYLDPILIGCVSPSIFPAFRSYACLAITFPWSPKVSLVKI